MNLELILIHFLKVKIQLTAKDTKFAYGEDLLYDVVVGILRFYEFLETITEFDLPRFDGILIFKK